MNGHIETHPADPADPHMRGEPLRPLSAMTPMERLEWLCAMLNLREMQKEAAERPQSSSTEPSVTT